MLLLLLVGLAVVAAFGVPRIEHELSATPSVSAAASPLVQREIADHMAWLDRVCSSSRIPTLLPMPLRRFESAIRASGLWGLAGSQRPAGQGLQTLAGTWSDGLVDDGFYSDLPSYLVNAGYEVDWLPDYGYDTAADLFIFPTDRDADAFIGQAANGQCRNGADVERLPQPHNSYAVIWVHPDGWLGADIFFARANRVYRVGQYLPPDESVSVKAAASPEVWHRLVASPDELACEFEQAACRYR